MSAEPHSQYNGPVEEPFCWRYKRTNEKTNCIIHQSMQSLLASGQAGDSVDDATLSKVFSASIKQFATTKLREELEQSDFTPEQHNSMID